MQVKYASNLSGVAGVLKQRYNDFAHYNLVDPIDELVFIICSTRTTERCYLSAFRSLKKEFPTLNDLSNASEEAISATIAKGGLSRIKAKAINGIIKETITCFGTLSFESLRTMTDRRVEDFLTSLPCVGKKVARCVMMYSLGRQVFPVDTHCWRVARRIGWVRKTHKDERPSSKDMDRLQSKIPPALRYSLHVNLISLGREFCTSKYPRCEKCPILSYCKRIGVAR